MEIWHSNIHLRAPPIHNILMLWKKRRKKRSWVRDNFNLDTNTTKESFYFSMCKM